ncbi:MAG TPA: hypothetical protein VFS07_04805 [Gemmatimonadales bacterium]|jgi:hypothetical protein|nr:hypothetical protein [Gemmatimonadales bacterium]
MIGELTGLVAVLAIFGLPGIWLLGKTPIGQALVHRIAHGVTPEADPQMLAELDELRARLADVEDRLDFAERQITSGGAPRAPQP